VIENPAAEAPDPVLAALFAGAEPPAPDQEFTEAVMDRTRRFKWRFLTGLVLGFLTLAAVMLASYLAFPVLVTEWAALAFGLVSMPIISLGEGWLAWLLAPINTVGAILVALYKLIRMASKKAMG
jgi:hypothetical protein